MNKFGYLTLYGATDREFDIAPTCHMTPYAPYCFANLACCVVHRTLHNACRNCHICDPAVMEEFLQAVRATFGDGDKSSGSGTAQIVMDYRGKLTADELRELTGEPASPAEDPATIAAGAALEAITKGMGDVNAMFTKYSPEAVADFRRQWEAARVAGTLKIPMVVADPDDLAQVVYPLGEEVEEGLRQSEERIKARTLAELGGRPNPSGAIDLGSRWRPRRVSSMAAQERFADPSLDKFRADFRAPKSRGA